MLEDATVARRRRDGKYSEMLAAAISQADFEVMQSLARALRVHVDVLPDGPEIVGAIRAEVGPAAHPPDSPLRDGDNPGELA